MSHALKWDLTIILYMESFKHNEDKMLNLLIMLDDLFVKIQ